MSLGSIDGQVGSQTTAVGANGPDGFDSGFDYNSSEVAGNFAYVSDMVLFHLLNICS